MKFVYKTIDKDGKFQSGEIDSFSIDTAISNLQKRGLVISSIKPKDSGNFVDKIPFLNTVSNKDIVILSRQISTLFEAQVSALRAFKLIGTENTNPILRKHLLQVVDDLQGGSSISNALAKHPQVFSDFYVNMVRSGEESGKLDETFSYLADYMDRTYEVTSKAKNALIYPAFVIFTFIAVMVLMFTIIIPKIGVIIKDSGQEIPIYTKAVFAVSDFMINNGVIMVIGILLIAGLGYWYIKTEEGGKQFSVMRLYVPYVGDLFKKLYLSRFCDNMSTMISSGIPMLKSIEVTSAIIDNVIYKDLLNSALIKVKSGTSLSESISDSEVMPKILTQMVRVGEETGELGKIMKTMAKFYQREVINAVDTLVGLIEPVMIVSLGIGVGILLASVLVPIYNVASGL